MCLVLDENHPLLPFTFAWPALGLEPSYLHAKLLPAVPPSGAFMQVEQLVKQQFPGMEVEGSSYPVPRLQVRPPPLCLAAQRPVMASSPPAETLHTRMLVGLHVSNLMIKF